MAKRMSYGTEKRDDGELKVAPDGTGWLCPGCGNILQQGFIGARGKRTCRPCWDKKNKPKLAPSLEMVKPSVEVMSTPLAQARARTNRLKAGIENVKELLQAVLDNEDWRTLNYASWNDYCREEFGGRIPVPKSERADVVIALRDHGMTFRQIANVVDISKDTAQRVSNETPPIEQTCVSNETAAGDPKRTRQVINGINGLAKYVEASWATDFDIAQDSDYQRATGRLLAAIRRFSGCHE